MVTVLTAGTFEVQGSVLDGNGNGIEGALVEVVSGSGAGRRVLSDEDGAWALFGLSGAAELRASARGLTAQSTSIVVSGKTTTFFTLER